MTGLARQLEIGLFCCILWWCYILDGRSMLVLPGHHQRMQQNHLGIQGYYIKKY